MSWVGIPIVMFVNCLHEYMSPDTFSIAGLTDQYKINAVEQKAIDRDAIRERMRFFQMTQQHLGKTLNDFPFDATDLARFVLRVINGTLPDILDNSHDEEEIEFKQTPVPVLLSEMAYLKQLVKY